MAYEALANVLAQIGRGYEAGVAEDRARSQRLADIADERAYQDRVRDDTFKKQKELEAERLRMAEESEERRLKKLPELQIRAEAKSRGLDPEAPLGELRAQLLQLKLNETRLAAASDVRTRAELGTDPEVLAANAKAAEAAALAARNAELSALEKTADRAQAIDDKRNERAASALQTEFNSAAADIAALAPRVMTDPVAESAAVAVAQLRAGVLQRATPEALKKLKIMPAEFEVAMRTADIGVLSRLAEQLMVPVSDDQRTAIMTAIQRGQAPMVSMMGRAMERIQQVSDTAIRQNIQLDRSAYKGLASYMQPEPAAKPAAAPTGVKLPGMGGAPAPAAGGVPAPAIPRALQPAPAPAAPAAPAAPSWWSTQRDPEANRQAISNFFTQTVPNAIQGAAYGVTQRLNPVNYKPGWTVGVDAGYAYVDPRRTAMTRPLPAITRLPDLQPPQQTYTPQELQLMQGGPASFGTMRGLGVPVSP